MSGLEAVDRLSGLGLISNELSATQIDMAWSVLERHLRSRDVAENVRAPVPPSLQSLAANALAGVVGGLMAFLVAGELMKVLHPLAIWTLVSLRWAPHRGHYVGCRQPRRS